MRQEYVDYWKKHRPACVGLSRIGKKRWNVILANGTSKPVCILWSIVPRKYIGHNERGIKLRWKKYKQ